MFKVPFTLHLPFQLIALEERIQMYLVLDKVDARHVHLSNRRHNSQRLNDTLVDLDDSTFAES
jgi:hypothetical protein